MLVGVMEMFGKVFGNVRWKGGGSVCEGCVWVEWKCLEVFLFLCAVREVLNDRLGARRAQTRLSVR